MTPDLREQVSRLEACHGSPEPPAVTDPFEMVLWENVAYLVDDDPARSGDLQTRRPALRGLPADGRLSLVPDAVELRSGLEARGGISSTRRSEMQIQLTSVFRQVSGGYVAFVEELPGANTQGATLEEARVNLREAVALVLEANRVLAEEELHGADVIREPFKLTA